MKRHLWTGITLAISSVALIGCGTTPDPTAFNQAQAAYDRAANNPTVQQASPHEMEDAQEALGMAKTALSKKDTQVEVDHYSYLARRYAETSELRAKTRGAALQATAASRTITLGDMLFATGKADLNEAGHKAVSDLATYLKNYPSQTVAITGYTDSTGTARINAALSEQRAASVRTALVQDGINSARIRSRGEGPSNPVASNQTSAGRQQNRRVEVAILPGS